MNRKMQYQDTPELSSAISIVKKLDAAGFVAWFAGGCVRDAILNRAPKDFDVATTARPDQILNLFPNCIEVGKAFAVIRVIELGHEIEVATFRKEGDYLDGRHPSKLEFAGPLEDSARRDFTINALFYDPLKEQLYDFHNGLKDLATRVLRCVGDPRDRFQEDHLRILRALRFGAELEFELHETMKAALFAEAESVKKVSFERRRDELLKFFQSPGRAIFVESQEYTHVLSLCVDEPSLDVAAYRKWLPISKKPIPQESFCELFYWWAKSTKLFEQNNFSKRLKDKTSVLKLSASEAQFVSNALRVFCPREFISSSDFPVSELLEHSFKPGGSEGLSQLISKDLESWPESWRVALKDYKRRRANLESLPKAWISANDLSEFRGKELGEKLKWAFSAQLSGLFSSKDLLLDKVKNRN